MKKLFIVLGMVTAFILGYGAINTHAYYGQGNYIGYFQGAYDSSGWEVLNVSCGSSGEYGPYNYWNGNNYCNAIPRDLNNAAELEAFISYRLNNGIPNGSYGFSGGTYGDTRARTGAASIVHTMIGTPVGQRNRPPTAAQWNTWVSVVNSYQAQGRINWNTTSLGNSVCVNSLYQGTDNSPSPNDVTFYPQCRDGAMIVFYNPDGSVFVIRRECGNPMGGTSLQIQNFSVSGRSTVSNASPRPGDSITFQHFVKNNGPTDTSPTPIWWVAESTSPTSGGVGGPASGGTYAAGQEKNVFNHTITIPANATPNTQYCERVGWDPVNSAGARDGRGAPACATVRYDYSLTPNINAVITSGGVPIAGSIAEPGDTVTFTYSVRNTGLTYSQPVSCTYMSGTNAGHNTAAPGTGFTPAGAICPPNYVFPAGPSSNTTTATEANVPLPTINTTVCRSFNINPATQSGGTVPAAQACIFVAAKPYLRVFGGDVSAGNGQATACTPYNGAAVVSWNKGSSGAYAGAGAQYAVFALSKIVEFSSALGNTGGATTPSGLAFANTGITAGTYGGSYGALWCAQDYYNATGAGGLGFTDVTGQPTGKYALTGNTTMRGSIPAGKRYSIYVTGDVLINGPITYTGTWASNTTPLFELVVKGNIYISQSVTQLDGLYIAQVNAAGGGGTIYTCANTVLPGAAVATTAANYYTLCKNKLTVNGAFAAKQVQFLRTAGTLAQSTASEASAEVFNFNPSLWMAQPPGQATTNSYDSITSLPPIL